MRRAELMRTTPRILSASIAVSLLCIAQLADAQPIEAGVNATPAALILFDTSGSMEWLDTEDEYPLCLTNSADYGLFAGTLCTVDGDCATGMQCASGRCEFARSRFHAAVEVLTGTIQNYYPLCDDRTADSGRIDQANPLFEQGIRHSIACSRDPAGLLSSAQECYRTPNGSVIAPPGFRQRPDGLIDLYGSLISFGFMAFDSFEDPRANAAGMYSYGPSGWSSAPGSAPTACANNADCWNIGGRRPGNDVQGATIPPVDPANDNITRRQEINNSVQQSILDVVPYWSTPIGAILHDALVFYNGGDDGAYYSWYGDNVAGTDLDAYDYARGLRDPYGACRQKYAILITDGLPSFNDCVRRGSVTSSDPWLQGCEGYWYKDAEYYAQELLTAGVKTYVIGFNIVPPQFFVGDPLARLEAIAIAGGTDSVYFADGSRELLFQLGDILSQIAQGTPSRSRPVTTTRLRTGRVGEYRFQSRFEIVGESRYWKGELERVAFECVGATLQTEPTVESAAALLDARDLSTDPRNFYTSSPAVHSCWADRLGNTRDSPFDNLSLGSPVVNPLQGGAGLTTGEIADTCRDAPGNSGACLSLTDGNVGDPSLFTETEPNLADTCIVRLDTARATNHADSFGATSTRQAEVFLRWARGETLTELRLAGYADELEDILPANLQFDSATGMYVRDRLSSLADIYHSAPTLVASPDPRVSEAPDYREFVRANEDRPTVVYVGTNDGFLHAFDALTMEELWAYMPRTFLPRMGEWIAPGHTFMFDGPPTTADIVLDRRLGADDVEASWATVLVAGYRGGGRGYLAMNVTDPEKPQLLWELNSELDPQLGLAYSEPGLGTVLTNRCNSSEVTACERGIAIFGGGLPPTGADPSSRIGRVLYVVDLETGYVLRRFNEMTDTDGVVRPFEAAISGSVAAYNSFAGSLVTRAFVGDNEGNLLRVDLSDPNPANWRVDMFVRASETLVDPLNPGATDYGEVRFRPTVALDSQFRAVVMYGMGNTDELDDLGTKQNFVVSVTEAPRFDGDGRLTRVEGELNWAIRLAPFEKLTARPRIFNRRAFFATFVPNEADLCEVGGARLYGLDFVGDTEDPGYIGPVNCTDLTCYLNQDPADTDSELVAFWDSSTPGPVIQPRAIIHSLDIVQAATCFVEEATDPGTRGEFGQNNRISEVNQGDVQLQIASSYYGDAPAVGAAREALSEVTSVSIPAPQSRAVPASWTVIFE
jgi:hypothetical protein